MAKTKSNDPLDRFPKAPSQIKNRLISANFGFPGCGKTRWALGGPAPVVLLSLNNGYEGIIEDLQATKDIRVKDYEWLPDPDSGTLQADAQGIMEQFMEDYEVAIQCARTVIIDLESELWEVGRYAQFGAPSDNPKDFAPLNQKFRRIVNMAKATDVNLILLQAMKERWQPRVNKSSGKMGAASTDLYERWGFKELEGLVHVNIEHRRVKVPGESSRFEIELGKSRGPGSRDVQDHTFTVTDPDTGFLELALQMYPDSSPEDWQ